MDLGVYNLKYTYRYLRYDTEEMYLRDNFVDKALSVKEHKNAVVRPFIGVTIGEQYIDESYLHAHHDAPESFRFDPEDCKYVDEDVMYIGMFINIWGHCLTDCMKHLWIFLNEENRFKNLRLVWVASNPKVEMWENFWTLLDMLGVDRRRIVQVTENTKFKKVYIPDQCFFADENNVHRLYTKEYGQIFDRILSKVEARPKFDKIYLTRSKLTVHNRDYGEKSVEKVFKKKGYQIISPEMLPVKELIALLKSCKFFAATDGSICHNSIFLPKDAECVIIRKADTANCYQGPINQVRNLNVTIIDAHWSKLLYNRKAPWDGPFFIYPNENLVKWAGQTGLFPLVDFIRYVADGVSARVDAHFRKLCWKG